MTATALSDVRDLLGGEKFPGCESPSLRLEKFVRIGGDNTKREEIDAVVACQRTNGQKPVSLPLSPGGVRFPARLRSRLIVNQAGGILENAGMCLHPHFGYPYIPGSAVKGIARHAAWCEWHEAEEPEKTRIAQNIARVFGYPTNDKGLDAYLAERGCDTKRGGCISFWAAEPDGKASLVTDIVNCHHMKYYGSNDPSAVATDDESPNPQFFPVVEKGCTFLFTLVPVRDADEEMIDRAKKWLIKAITENGVGAKTSAGYGWFEYTQEEEERYHEKVKRLWMEHEEKLRIQKLTNRITALKEMDAVSPAFAAEIKALGQFDLEGLSQQAIEEFNRQRKRLPQLSPREEIRREWEGKSEKECALSHYVLSFSGKSSDVKTAVVDILRNHPVWKYLRAGNFTDIKKKNQPLLRQQVDAIRAFAKTTPEGKMP